MNRLPFPGFEQKVHSLQIKFRTDPEQSATKTLRMKYANTSCESSSEAVIQHLYLMQTAPTMILMR